MPLFERFAHRAGLGHDADLVDVVEAIRAIPYGRHDDRSPEGVVDAWRGTCSTKHLLLARLVSERWPEVRARLVHRVYRVTAAFAEGFGPGAAAAVPPDGLVDVHTYVTASRQGRRVRLDVTFPGAAWDGRSDMLLACGDGTDFEAGDNPLAAKEALVLAHCNRRVRDGFIAALETATAR